jgi:hypothetical protein
MTLGSLLQICSCVCAGPGSHYCENKGRCHASNHVFFVVSLRDGQFAQKCYDPDCSHFRSAWMPLPQHLVLEHMVL